MFFFHTCIVYYIKKKKVKYGDMCSLGGIETKDKIQSASVRLREVLCRPRHNSNGGYEETEQSTEAEVVATVSGGR